MIGAVTITVAPREAVRLHVTVRDWPTAADLEHELTELAAASRDYIMAECDRRDPDHAEEYRLEVIVNMRHDHAQRYRDDALLRLAVERSAGRCTLSVLSDEPARHT